MELLNNELKNSTETFTESNIIKNNGNYSSASMNSVIATNDTTQTNQTSVIRSHVKLESVQRPKPTPILKTFVNSSDFSTTNLSVKQNFENSTQAVTVVDSNVTKTNIVFTSINKTTGTSIVFKNNFTSSSTNTHGQKVSSPKSTSTDSLSDLKLSTRQPTTVSSPKTQNIPSTQTAVFTKSKDLFPSSTSKPIPRTETSEFTTSKNLFQSSTSKPIKRSTKTISSKHSIKSTTVTPTTNVPRTTPVSTRTKKLITQKTETATKMANPTSKISKFLKNSRVITQSSLYPHYGSNTSAFIPPTYVPLINDMPAHRNTTLVPKDTTIGVSALVLVVILPFITLFLIAITIVLKKKCKKKTSKRKRNTKEDMELDAKDSNQKEPLTASANNT